jgi:hypothetical protein
VLCCICDIKQILQWGVEGKILRDMELNYVWKHNGISVEISITFCIYL